MQCVPLQTIKMPTKYKIQSGDNLTKISKHFGVSIATIKDANPQIKDINLIYAGDTLVIPSSSEAQLDLSKVKQWYFDIVDSAAWFSNRANVLSVLNYISIGDYKSAAEIGVDTGIWAILAKLTSANIATILLMVFQCSEAY